MKIEAQSAHYTAKSNAIDGIGIDETYKCPQFAFHLAGDFFREIRQNGSISLLPMAGPDKQLLDVKKPAPPN